MSEDKQAKILIVDDEPDILDMIESLLDSEGYDVIQAEGGEEALEKLSEKPDLVLLDIMMPDMDGHAVLQEIRKNYSLQDLPVVMVTARNDVVDIGGALDHNVNGFVVKPFDVENLLRIINSILRTDPVSFYTNYERVSGVTGQGGTGYQQGDRIIFLDIEEEDPEADIILEALDQEGVYLMSILQYDSESGKRQSSVLLTAESGMNFGAFLNALMQAGGATITACQIFKDALDLPQDLMSDGQEYSLE
jgi:DNA-binding response OmpR family regulator